MENHFFTSWEALIRIAVVGIISYAALLILLRAAGKRTLSRMNAYDMVITMALGSILAKVSLTKDISISESVTAMFVLIGLQYSVSLALSRFRPLRKLLCPQPAVLFHKGEFIENVMRKERVDKDDIQAAIYSKGIADNSMVEAVILGANGELSVLLAPRVTFQINTVMSARPSGA